jgi:hypothetical protein
MTHPAIAVLRDEETGNAVIVLNNEQFEFDPIATDFFGNVRTLNLDAGQARSLAYQLLGWDTDSRRIGYFTGHGEYDEATGRLTITDFSLLRTPA